MMKQDESVLSEAVLPQNMPQDELESAPSSSRPLSLWLLRASVLLGFIALLYYLSWWLEGWLARWPALILVFLLALLYAGMQLVANWVLYVAVSRPRVTPTYPSQTSVDVFVTACGEPYTMVEGCLSAACAMRGEHHTWLLDDGADPGLASLAERLGAGYLSRSEHLHAKAGNLNSALPRTKADILVIFDIDHVPTPDFLEKTVGFFNDPRVGFVQVMLTFSNRDQSWVAASAVETSLDYYNPTSLGADGLGGTTMMGSNALIRRKALEAIGGYQPGLAEDLATSIALHAAGWHSVYVPEPLAPGIAPPDLAAWFTQQLKWARGVFELLLTAYPRLFMRLTRGQRTSYAVRMTKYWIGPAVGFHLFATIGILIWGDSIVRAAFHDYLRHITPLAFSDVLIRFIALRIWQHRQIPRATLLRAITLVYATWPIYMLAWFMALFRLPLSFRPTPKETSKRLHPIWLAPQLIAVSLLVAGMLFTILVKGHPPSLLLMFASLQGLLQLSLLARWLSTPSNSPTAR